MSQRRFGFTLVELLVALAVLGLMMVMVTRSLSFVATARERAAGHSEMAQSLGTGLRIVDSELSRALPLQRITADGNVLWFQGNEVAVRFITASLLDEVGPPFSLWQLRLLPNGEGQILEVRRKRGDLAEFEPEQLTEVAGRELLRTQMPLAFYFRKAADEEEPASWVETWRDAPELPEAVMLAATAGPDEAWPPWVVPLRIHQLFYCDQSYSGEVPDGLCTAGDETSQADNEAQR
ncbi:MAG: prepilin-type N-terminal cleavage/methylation domain-containing protein [Pseudomonadota bacterium]